MRQQAPYLISSATLFWVVGAEPKLEVMLPWATRK